MRKKNDSRTLATTLETVTTAGAQRHTAAQETTGTSGDTKSLSLFQSSCVCESPVDLTDGSSNGNASETKANESFDNGVFYDIEAKGTPSIESELFSKRSE